MEQEMLTGPMVRWLPSPPHIEIVGMPERISVWGTTVMLLIFGPQIWKTWFWAETKKFET